MPTALDPRFYQSSEMPSASPGSPGAPLLNASAKGLADVAGGLDQASKIVYAADTQRAVMQGHTQVAEALDGLQTAQDNLKTTWGDDPTGFTPAFHKMAKDVGDQLIEQQTNPTAKQYVTQAFDRLGMAQVKAADVWERNQQVVYRGAQVQKQTDSYTKIVAGDPSQFEAIRQTLNDSIDNAGFEPSIRQKVRDATTKQLAVAANQSYIENDPHGAFAAYSTALGLQAIPPTLPTPSATPGSAAPAVDTPINNASSWPGGVDPQLDAAIASAQKRPSMAVPIKPTTWNNNESRSPLQILQDEKTAQQHIYAQRQADAPTTVATAGTTANDAGPGYTMPLDPTTSDRSGTATGKPYVDTLTTQELVTLRNEAHSRMLAGQSGARAELERQLQNVEVAAKNGMVAPDIPRSLFDAAYPDKPTADAKYATLGAWQDFGTDVKTIQTMPGTQIEQYVAGIKPTDTGAVDFAARMTRWQATAAAAGHVMTARQEDPVLTLGSEGVWRVNPLDLGNPAGFQAELANRQQNSSSAQGVYVQQPVVFSKGESKALAGVMQSAPFAMQVQMLGALRNGLTDDATYRAALQQIHPDAPEIAAIGALAAIKPGYELAPGFATPQASGELALRGAAILHPSKQQKETDGVGSTPIMPDPKQLEAAFADKVGDAYAGHPGALRTDFQVFREIYAGAAARDGVIVSDDKSPNDKLVTEALNGSTGGVVEVGGHRVIKPYGMPDDVFASRYAEAYHTELVRNALNPDSHAASDYPPVNAGDGTYYLRAGAGYLMSPINGQPVQIEVPTNAIVTQTGPMTRTTTAPPNFAGRRLVKGQISQ